LPPLYERTEAALAGSAGGWRWAAREFQDSPGEGRVLGQEDAGKSERLGREVGFGMVQESEREGEGEGYARGSRGGIARLTESNLQVRDLFGEIRPF
jgi:hypothetical protein